MSRLGFAFLTLSQNVTLFSSLLVPQEVQRKLLASLSQVRLRSTYSSARSVLLYTILLQAIN